MTTNKNIKSIDIDLQKKWHKQMHIPLEITDIKAKYKSQQSLSLKIGHNLLIYPIRRMSSIDSPMSE